MKTENNNSNLDWMIHWSLTGHHPRNTQIKLINKINLAINEGYKNIILEARIMWNHPTYSQFLI